MCAGSVTDVAVRAEAGGRGAGTLVERLAPTCDSQLVLGVLDPLLELPAVRVRLALLDTLELALGGLELLACAGVVDLAREHGVVDERDRTVELHLEEARTRRVLPHLAVAVDVDARGAG